MRNSDTGRTWALSDIAALLLLSLTAIGLLRANVETLGIVKTFRSGFYPVAGNLIGFDVIANTEWRPALEEGDGQDVVLFPFSSADIDYWGDIALQSQMSRPKLQFVGVCDKAETCALASEQRPFAILSHMDPTQMHAVAVAKRLGQALLYRDTRLMASLDVIQDPTTMAYNIAAEFAEAE